MRGKSVRSLIGVSFILILTLITLVAACAKPAPTPAATVAPTKPPAPATAVAPAKPPAPATTPAPAVKPAAKEIVWRLLSWVGKDEVANAPAMALIKKVNDALKGEFQIEFKGGPEVVKPTDIAQAVLNKVGEIGHVPPTYYTSILPLNT
ncbi:MAG: hypothetical protein HYX83_00475, partial [Chloroflexi bacterium]|nr:hypothetical protein [Chloroflexota bacterium]